jgi:transcription antitermination factor NusG
VASLLRHKGYAEFLPLYRTRRRWSDRFKEVELPLFPGYLFARFDPLHRLPILTIPGIEFIVGIGKAPVPVDDEEVQAIQTIVESGLKAEPWPFLQVGNAVRIINGPLFGVEGILLEEKKQHRLIVSVTLLQRSVSVEIDRGWVLPVSGPRLAASPDNCDRLQTKDPNRQLPRF